MPLSGVAHQHARTPGISHNNIACISLETRRLQTQQTGAFRHSIQARPISTNPGCLEEECEYGITSGTCFTARRLEVVAVAGLLWICFVVFFFSVWWDFVFFFVFFTSTAHGLLQVRGNLASCTSLLVMRQGRGSEATEADICL